MPRRSPFSISLDEEWKLWSKATTLTSCGLASAQSACTRATSTRCEDAGPCATSRRERGFAQAMSCRRSSTPDVRS